MEQVLVIPEESIAFIFTQLLALEELSRELGAAEPTSEGWVRHARSVVTAVSRNISEELQKHVGPKPDGFTG